MAITISAEFTVTGAQAITQATAQATGAFKGLQEQVAQTERATTSASTSLTGLVDGLLFVTRNLTVTSAAFRESVGSIQAAIKANTAYAQSLASIAAAAASAQKAVSGSILGGRALGGAGAESVASLQAAAKAGISYQQSLVSINEAATQYARTQKTVQQQTQQTSHSIGGLINSFKGLAVAAGVSFSIAGLVDLTKSIVEAGIANERLMLSLKGALGTAQAAGEAYAFVEGVANRLGIGLQTAVEGFAKLSAATQGTVVQGQATRDLFVSLAEASRVMGLTTSETGGVVTALTQIIGKNTVSMEELRQQLGERLPQVLRLTAKEMGVTTSRFIEMVSKGEILAQDFIPAVTRAFQQMGKEAPAAAASVQAALERLGNAWLTLKVTIAQSGLLELVARIGEEMTRIINQTTNWVNRTKRMAGEMGLTPLVQEMQRVTQEIQMWQEVLAQDPFEPSRERARAGIAAAEQQRDVLAKRIEMQQKALETSEKARHAEEAGIEAQLKAQAAEDNRVKTLRDLSKAYTGLEDDIKGVALQLEALRSFDVPSLQAMQIDPFGPDFEQRFRERETALLKQQKELLDKRAGLSKADSARAVQEAGQSAVEIAKAREEALANNLKREESMIQQSADERRRIIDQEAAAALQAQGPGAVEAIEAKRTQARRAAAIDEAHALEKIRLDTLAQEKQFIEARLQTEIAAAGKNLSAQTKAQEDLKNLEADTEAERVKIRAKTAEVTQQISKKSVDDQIADARELLKREAEFRQEALQSQAGLLDAEQSLVQAQVEGLVLTREEGITKIQALEVQAFDIRRAQLEEAFTEEKRILQGRVDANQAAQSEITKLETTHKADLQALNIQQQTLEQDHRNELLQGWIDWVRDVRSGLGDFLFRWADGQVNSIKDVFDDLKSYFFRMIADMIAYAATNAIIVPIVSTVLGGFGGGAIGAAGTAAAALGVPGLGGGAGGPAGGGGLMQVLGLAGVGNQLSSMFGAQGLLGTGIDWFTQQITNMGGVIQGWFGPSGTLPNVFSGFASDISDLSTATLQAPRQLLSSAANVPTAISPLMALGGAAGLGGGIYSAITAQTMGGRVGGAIGAAGGATALIAGLMPALMGTLSATLGPIGLALAALAPLLGSFLGGLGAPAGPRFALGGLGGVGIGAEGGRLDVRGRVTSQVGRQARLPEGTNVGAIQEALQARVQTLVEGMVTAINAVALQPESLLGQTQDALNQALRDAIRINSSSAKNFQKDMEEQIKFAGTQVGSFFLKPLNEAFRQLESADLEQQIARLPETTTGMVSVFKGMNDQLDELSKVANTDVLRQLSSVRNRVEDFGNALADTARVIATDIVSGTVMRLESQVKTLLDQPLAEQIHGFAGLMNQSFQALEALRTTQRGIGGAGLETGGITGQIDILTTAMVKTAADVSTQIVNGALGQLSSELSQVTAQAVSVQATTVNSLFNDSLAALQALWDTWHRLEETGLDAGPIQAQFTKLLGGILDTTTMVLDQALAEGSFAEFLGVLASIPKAVTDLNPAFAKLQALGAIFGQVVGPIAQNIATLEDAMRTTAERADVSATRIADLRSAIADAGDSADQSLPLYAQLSTAIMANAELQIQVIRAMQQAWQAALDQVQSDIDTLEAAFGYLEGQVSRAVNSMTTSFSDFTTALAGGDMLGAIESIHAYEQDVMALTQLQIQQIEAQRQATIDAQQEVIDGVQDQVDVQQKVIDGVQDQMDAQQKVIDATQKQIDGQQKVIDSTQDLIDAQQKVIDGVQDQIDAQQEVIAGIQDQINAVEEAARAQKEYINLLQDEVNVRQEAVDSLTREIESLRQLRDRVGELTRAEVSPARAAPAIREQIAATQAQLATVGGEDAITALEKLISLNQELLQLGEESSQLTLIQEALNNLNVLQADLNARLAGRTAELGVAEQQLQVAQAAVDTATLQLDALNAQIAAMNEQLKAQQDVLKGIEAQLKFQQAQLEALHDQLAFDQANLKVLHTQLAFDQAQLSVLADQLAVEQGELKLLNDQLAVEQESLRRIQESTYWDQQIAQVQTIALHELYKIRDWLQLIQGDTSWEDQVLAIQRESLAWLRAMEHDLQALFIKTAENVGAAGISLDLQRTMIFWLDKISQYNMALPMPIRVTNFYEAPRQRGGLVGLPSGLHYAQGGLVPTLLEPGERVFTSPTSMQRGALMAMNAAFPRFANGGFTVPGSGTGDSVPMMLPSGSFVLNRNAAGTLGRQNGGPVPGNGGTTEVHQHHYHFPNLTFREGITLEQLRAMMREMERRSMRRDKS